MTAWRHALIHTWDLCCVQCPALRGTDHVYVIYTFPVFAEWVSLGTWFLFDLAIIQGLVLHVSVGCFPWYLVCPGSQPVCRHFEVLPVLSIPNSISTYRLDNGIAVPNRKGTKWVELLPKLSHPGTDTHRSGVRSCKWGDPPLIVVGHLFLGA